MEQLMQDMLKNTKDIQNFWETRMSGMMDEWVKSQHFVNALTKSLEGSLDLRQFIDASIGRWAEFYQLVTKKDISVLQQQMYDQNLRFEKALNLLQDIRNTMVQPAAHQDETTTDKPAPTPKAKNRK